MIAATPRAARSPHAAATAPKSRCRVRSGSIRSSRASNSAATSAAVPTYRSEIIFGLPSTQPISRITFGVLFLLLAGKQWRGRPAPGEQAPPPKWMAALDTFGPGKSLGLGAALSGVNPKNLVLTIAAAASIAQAGLPGVQQVGVLAVFIVLGSVTVAAPLVIYLAMGAKAAGILEGWRTWLAGHNAAIMLVLFLVFGVLLVGQGIAGLS